MPSVEWKRYGRKGSTIHAAHAFVDGKQLCHVKHGLRTGLYTHERIDYGPHPVALHFTGVPFGRVCARCLKLSRRSPYGMSDAAEFGRQERMVRDAAYRLAQALASASEGHRGWSISRLDLETMVNEYMKDARAPFHLRVGDPR